MAVTLYVATILARRPDGTNVAIVEVRRQLESGKPHGMIAKIVETVEQLLTSVGGDLAYAGYPYNPFELRMLTESTRAEGIQPRFQLPVTVPAQHARR